MDRVAGPQTPPTVASATGQPDIRNHEELLTHGQLGPRTLALRVARTGLAACDPARAVERALRLEGEKLIVNGVEHRLDSNGRIVVLGSGKASLAIAAAVERALGPRLAGGIVAVRDASGPKPERVRVVEASHPLPDARSVAAAEALLEAANALGPDDILIACFTGGSSALTSLPPEGVPEEDKLELHRLLLSSGMPIAAINTVRKQASAFKGGRLALAAAPAEVINLTVSDVAGDPIDAITDPTVANGSSAADAISTLSDFGLWDAVPATVREHLTDPGQEQPDLTEVDIQTELLVTGEEAASAMSTEAALAGAKPVLLGTGLEEDAAALGRLLGQIAAESYSLGRPFPPPSVLLGCGGESTVRLESSDAFGHGGPNRESALAAAERFAGAEVAAVFLDTDGSDGGGEVAGAISDGQTLARAAGESLDLRGALASHRTAEVVEALGDAIETGPTHTNVNDLFAIAIGGGGR
jgi:glycerate 2-kinase